MIYRFCGNSFNYLANPEKKNSVLFWVISINRFSVVFFNTVQNIMHRIDHGNDQNAEKMQNGQ